MVADLDCDGKADIVVANHGFSGGIGNTISVLRNVGAPGTVTLAPKVDFVTTNGPHDIAVVDIDGDGKPDVVTPNYGAFASGNTISVLRNLSTPGTIPLGAAANFITAPAPAGPGGRRFLYGDGKPDVVATSFNDGSGTLLSVLRNTSTPGAVSFAPTIDYGTAKGPYGIAVGDLDGDGKLTSPSSRFRILRGRRLVRRGVPQHQHGRSRSL